MTTKFTQRLQEAKQELGLSNRRIVEAAAKGGHGISDYTVTTCLNGKHGNVTRTTVQALAYALRIPEQELAALAGHAEQQKHLALEGRLREDAESLTKVQADAVAEIIRQLAVANRKAVAGHDNQAPIAEGDELADRRRDLTQYQIDNERHVAATKLHNVEPDEDIT